MLSVDKIQAMRLEHGLPARLVLARERVDAREIIECVGLCELVA